MCDMLQSPNSLCCHYSLDSIAGKQRASANILILLQKQLSKNQLPGECREQQFELQAKYSADSPVPESFDRDIGRFMLGPPKSVSGGDKAKLKVVVPSQVQ